VVFIRRVFSSRLSNVELTPASFAGVFFCARRALRQSAAARSALELAAHPVPAVSGETAELGRPNIRPLGGAGGPPRKFARHLPVERDGTMLQLMASWLCTPTLIT
jgi:hypothetical protein